MNVSTFINIMYFCPGNQNQNFLFPIPIISNMELTHLSSEASKYPKFTISRLFIIQIQKPMKLNDKFELF